MLTEGRPPEGLGEPDADGMLGKPLEEELLEELLDDEEVLIDGSPLLELEDELDEGILGMPWDDDEDWEDWQAARAAAIPTASSVFLKSSVFTLITLIIFRFMVWFMALPWIATLAASVPILPRPAATSWRRFICALPPTTHCSQVLLLRPSVPQNHSRSGPSSTWSTRYPIRTRRRQLPVSPLPTLSANTLY